MQLTVGTGRLVHRPLASLVARAAAAAVLTCANAASADPDYDDGEAAAHADPKSAPARADAAASREPSKPSMPLPPDTATEHVGLEMAGYQDSDAVTVLTPSIRAGIENVSGAHFEASYLVDVVSAASVDIVSTASSRWQEVRQAGSFVAGYKPHDFGVDVGGSFSSEPDYLSYGLYSTATKDFDEKNWSLTFGYGYSHDIAGRCGDNGQCTPFSVFSRPLERGSFMGGISWVVDRSSLASVTGDVIIENGDQSKVYRYIPMFSPTIAPQVPVGASIDVVNANRLPERPLEQLPLERHRFALTGRYAHRLDGSTVRAEERIYWDDWGMVASSTDGRWIFDLGRRLELWPHARFHAQKAVGFWQLAYVSGPGGANADAFDLPLYRTGDRELGPLWTADGGGGMKWYVGGDGDPRQWQLGAAFDAMYTAFLDDLYVTNRVAYLGTVTLEVTW